MRTIYVRPGRHLLPHTAYGYFGSGCGSLSVAAANGSREVLGSARRTRDNGFVEWHSCLVDMPEGASWAVSEWWYPGGNHSRVYVASLTAWREQRRAQLIALFAYRKSLAAKRAQRTARAVEIETRLRAAIAEHARLTAAANATAFGRSGGRARRRAVALNRAAADQRTLAAALASVWLVEIAGGTNPRVGDRDLESRTVRWEYTERYARFAVPAGTEIAKEWLRT